MSRINSFLATVAVCTFVLPAARNAFSQESRATLGGKVTDQQGRIIPKAAVIVTADLTGVIEHTTTNGSGDWRVQFLVPGPYHFSVSAAGFKTTDHSAIELQVADQKFIDSRLLVGERNDTVEVEATTPLIDTTAAVSGTVVTTKQLEELPTQSHSPIALVGLVPGATVGASTGGSVHLWSNISNSNVSVNGAGTGNRANNYQLDGGNDTNAAGQIAFVPPSDSVAEFRVVTNAYDAAIGRQAGSTIALTSKTGTLAYHGILYEYNQNNFLNARPYNQLTTSPVPPVHVNEYGGNVGGPVRIPFLYDGRKRKTFFFYSFDGIRNKQPGNTGFVTLPTLLERKGDFSQSFVVNNGVKYPVKIYDPASINATTGNRTLIGGAGTQIPTVNPIAAAIFALLPAPDRDPDTTISSNANNYIKQEVQDDKFASNSLRLDQSWGNAQHSYVNLRTNNWNEISFDPFGASNILNAILQHRTNRGMTLDHTIVFSPKFLLDLRYNVNGYYGSSANPSGGVSPSTLGFNPALAALEQLPSLPRFDNITPGVESTGIGTDNGSSYTNDTFQTISVGITQTLGNHNFRYGGEYMIQQEGTGGLGQAGGTFQFGNNFTTLNPNASNGPGVGSGLASFELGLATSGTLPHNATAFFSQHYTGVYFQDDWKTTSKLTLNFGLRWDYERPITERFDRLASRYDPTLIQQSATSSGQANYAALVGGGATNPGVALLQQYRGDPSTFVARGGLLFAGVNGTSRSVVNPRYKYFQPRLGFAYQVHKDTVIRGGLGRFVQPTFFTGGQPGFSTSTPFIATTDNYYTAASTFSNPYPTGIIQPTGSSLGTATNVGRQGNYTDPNIGRPYTDEASAYLQQQIGSVLIEIGGTLDLTRGTSVYDPITFNNGFSTNVPSAAAWRASFGPTFDATGRPNDTQPGSVQVANPFLGNNSINSGFQNSKTTSAYQLLRPNPLLTGDVQLDQGKGRDTYYALNTKVEKRFKRGFSVLQSFTWSKRISMNTFIGPQVAAPVIERRLDSGDQRFHYVLTPLWQLPLGRGQRFLNHGNRFVELAVGGFEVTGIYQFQSGTPLVLPTNSSFYLTTPTADAPKTRTHVFNTSRFYPYPNKSTERDHSSGQKGLALSDYPGWTGVQSLPGASFVPTAGDLARNGVYQDFSTRVTYNQTTFGDIRNPYLNDFTLGARKSFNFTESVRFQLRIDAFNALNHPRFGNIDTNPSDGTFGYLGGSARPTAVNSPRQIELGGKLFF